MRKVFEYSEAICLSKLDGFLFEGIKEGDYPIDAGKAESRRPDCGSSEIALRHCGLNAD